MEIEQIKKNLEKLQWYNQGAAVKPLYISYPWYACSLMKINGQEISVKYKIAVHIANNFMDDYISKESLREVADFYYKRQIEDNFFIQKLISNWRQEMVRSYLDLIEEIGRADFSKLGEKELLDYYKKFNETYLSVWHEAIFLDGFDYYGEYILKEIVEKEGKNISSADLDSLLIPPELSFTQKERIEVLTLAEKILKDVKTAKYILHEDNCELIGSEYEWIQNELKKISDKFYWMHNDFATVDYLKPDYFYQNLRKILGNQKAIENEREMLGFAKELQVKKNAAIERYYLSEEFENVVNFLAVLGNFRDERKTYNQIACNLILKFAQEFSKRSGIELRLIENLNFWDLENIFEKRNELIELAEKRANGFICLEDAKVEENVFYGETAVELSEFFKKEITKTTELKGRPAFPGLVIGKVKVINDKNDFHKMGKGDVLVAPNTRPEFVPIMKISGAIITDEGGITCHAAIVSRELKIPCIVGIQGVTSALSDGDEVEVDAENGVVKILSKA